MHERIAGVVVAAMLLAACGGGNEGGGTPAAATAENAAPASATATGSGPDPAAAQERLLFNANLAVPDSARLVSYRETGVRYDGPDEMQSVIVSYEAELEFVTDTYFHTDHKAGERSQVYGEIEYMKEGGQWRLMTMDIHPR